MRHAMAQPDREIGTIDGVSPIPSAVHSGTYDAIYGTMSQNHLFSFLFLSAAAVPMMLGCQTAVIGGGQGGSGGSPPSGVGGSVTTGVGGSLTTGSGVNPTPAASGNARPAEGGYLVTLANYAYACGDPGVTPSCSADVWWAVKFEVPTAGLVPGTTLPLDQAHGFFTEQLAGNAAQSDCGYGAGTYFGSGTVEIVAVSATELTLKVAGTGAAAAPEGGFDGTYTVPICEGVTPQNNGTAIAMNYDETPGNSGSSAGVGSGNAVCTGGGGGGTFIDPDTLMLFVSNLGQSCTDPYHTSQGCIESRYQIEIQIPVNQQATGIVQLQGITSLTLSGSLNGPASCFGGGGTYWDGTLAITAINATSVTFTLAGTADIGLGFGNADGTYTAPRCF